MSVATEHLVYTFQPDPPLENNPHGAETATHVEIEAASGVSIGWGGTRAAAYLLLAHRDQPAKCAPSCRWSGKSVVELYARE